MIDPTPTFVGDRHALYEADDRIKPFMLPNATYIVTVTLDDGNIINLNLPTAEAVAEMCRKIADGNYAVDVAGTCRLYEG